MMNPAIYLEYERISDVLLYFGSNTYLRLIVEPGYKDKNGNKLPLSTEYRYPSNKYNNVSHSITVKRRFKSYLVIEYPGEDLNNIIVLREYNIMGLLNKMQEFDKNIEKAFAYNKKNKLILLSDSITKVTSFPNEKSQIDFEQDIYYSGPDKDIPKIGVSMTLNNEYRLTFPAFTTWKSFLYLITKCDLYGWGSSLISNYFSGLIGKNVMDIETGFTKHYIPKEDNVNGGAKIKKQKPLNKEDELKNFFDSDFK